jgi:hypothetical protein
MYYELATMTLPFGTAPQAATQVQAFATASEARGELLGCWTTDIGTLNQMIVLRGFGDLACAARRTRAHPAQRQPVRLRRRGLPRPEQQLPRLCG